MFWFYETFVLSLTYRKYKQTLNDKFYGISRLKNNQKRRFQNQKI